MLALITTAHHTSYPNPIGFSAGERVRIKTRHPLGERKKFAGTLVGLADGQVELDIDGERVAIPLASIDKARLDPQF